MQRLRRSCSEALALSWTGRRMVPRPWISLKRRIPGSYFAIFMDMQMPVMEGIEATKKIRNSVREDNDVPIFAMTANTFATDRKRCADAGIFRNR